MNGHISRVSLTVRATTNLFIKKNEKVKFRKIEACFGRGASEKSIGRDLWWVRGLYLKEMWFKSPRCIMLRTNHL
jgi:hypothetical protein